MWVGIVAFTLTFRYLSINLLHTGNQKNLNKGDSTMKKNNLSQSQTTLLTSVTLETLWAIGVGCIAGSLLLA
jgi:hypothetical protein